MKPWRGNAYGNDPAAIDVLGEWFGLGGQIIVIEAMRDKVLSRDMIRPSKRSLTSAIRLILPASFKSRGS